MHDKLTINKLLKDHQFSIPNNKEILATTTKGVKIIFALEIQEASDKYASCRRKWAHTGSC